MFHIAKLTKRIVLARRLPLLAAFAAAVLAGCTPTEAVTDPNEPVIVISEVRALPESAAVTVGGSVRLSADVRDDQGRAVTGETVTWSTSDPAVASVDNAGSVQLLNTGNVEITATVRGRWGRSRIRSTPIPVGRVVVSPTSASLQVGQSTMLSAATLSDSGVALGGRAVTWSSSNPSVASVSASGQVGGLAAGSATITATSEGAAGTAAMSITLAPPVVTTVAVTPAANSIVTGATRSLTASVADQYGNAMAGQTVSWSSTNTAVATVSASGVVTGVAAGSATIRATVGSVTGSSSFTVSAPAPVVTTIAVSPNSNSIVSGTTRALTAAVSDQYGAAMSGQTVTWSSTNTAVATVNASGVVTGVAAGSATIRATIGAVVGSSAFTVTAPVAVVATVTVGPSSASVQTGSTVSFTATAADAVGTVITGQAVTWSSTNTAVATVNASGVVTGVAAGSATIRATIAGITGSATATVTAPPPVSPTSFSNEPAGFRLLTEWKNGAALRTNGWYDDGNPSGWGQKTVVSSGYQGTPRIGGASVIQTYYAGGVEGGHDAGRMQYDLPGNTNEVFFGAELQFAANYPTSSSTGGNKQLFVTFSGGGRYFLNMDIGGAAGRWDVYVGSSPLATTNVPVAYGTWTKIEWYLKRNPGSADDVMRVWIDGVLSLNLTNLDFPAGSMVLAYDDGSNNGNHLVEGDARSIRYVHGAAVAAYRWSAAYRVSVP